MDESILKDTKKLLGLMGDYDAFDRDIIIFINGAFGVLNQLGVGPSIPFKITGHAECWSDFSQDDRILGMLQEYIYLKVKKIFEASSLTSYVSSAIDAQINELEFRLRVTFDH